MGCHHSLLFDQGFQKITGWDWSERHLTVIGMPSDSILHWSNCCLAAEYETFWINLELRKKFKKQLCHVFVIYLIILNRWHIKFWYYIFFKDSYFRKHFILFLFLVALKLIFKVISDKWYPYPESNPNQTLESIFAAFALTVSWSVFATEFATISTTINIYVEMFYKILTTMVVTAVSLYITWIYNWFKFFY